MVSLRRLTHWCYLRIAPFLWSSCSLLQLLALKKGMAAAPPAALFGFFGAVAPALCGPPPPPWSQRGHTHLGKPCPLCALLLDCPAGETRRRHQFDWGGRCGGGSGIAPPAGGAGVVARPHLYYNRGSFIFPHRQQPLLNHSPCEWFSGYKKTVSIPRPFSELMVCIAPKRAA